MSQSIVAGHPRHTAPAGQNYRIEAKIYLRGDYGRRTLTVDHEGSFDFSGREPPLGAR